MREAVLALAARGDGPPTTRSPTVQPVTSAPTAATVPENSWPSITPVAPAPLEEEVQVGAADPAVAHLEQELARARAAGVGRSSTATSRSPMNTAAGIVVGQSCVMPEGSPEPDTHVNYARGRECARLDSAH